MARISFSHMKYSDGLTVVAISIFTAILCEFLSWLLIYRTITYKSLKATISKASKKLENLKNIKSGEVPKKSKIRKTEFVLLSSCRDLYLFRFKAGTVLLLFSMINFGVMNNLFEGKPVAKLPFVPFQIIQRMSHRGLSSNDMTDCSMFFLYFLCSFVVRTNLQKLLGFSLPSEASFGKLASVPV